MKLGLIFARAANGVIGRHGGLPWHLPEDLAHFKQVTLGCPVIMGRKTWDSLPPRFRPLPGRRNIVVTRQPGWQAEGAQRAGSLREALALCEGQRQAWVIGGAELYRLALPHAQVVEATEIGAEYDGDAYAPDLGPAWLEVARERHQSPAGLPFDFVTYHRAVP
ncbi:dihydrofolate reductase [Ramlibacter tataouinensis]|uniref:Dihydrofolate reductase n=1 Tax=Ramlibacter tataouinensis (strain ATCC BAA-407 / DSM 14655 / LMG 21543 / TTB310) TaxID=365046 RepID=F5Y474_RAMTT|nr:dihydrofolate reductase [Ramlibacter tataouinensis]AEG92539.1 candidate dihydrofolate reductase [Ramlibacter tataouinensis TTB310]